MYQPKLYLEFQPSIANDTIGQKQLMEILGLIEQLYPEVSWWEGQSPTEYNPFDFDEVQDEYPYEEITSLTIGYFPGHPNRLTFGFSGENEKGYTPTDGWAWYEENKIDYDETTSMFDMLDENDYKPKLTLEFDPIIKNNEAGQKQLKEILEVIESNYPNVTWANGPKPTKYNPLTGNEGLVDGIGFLSIGYYSAEPNDLTFSENIHNKYKGVDGWAWYKENKVDLNQTSAMFDMLGESSTKPKLNLKFDPTIKDGDAGQKELKEILGLIEELYPEVTWSSGVRPRFFNPFDYAPEVGSITIGYFPGSPNNLTWDTGYNPLKSIDGRTWYKKNRIDYDKTTSMFDMLGESKCDGKIYIDAKNIKRCISPNKSINESDDLGWMEEITKGEWIDITGDYDAIRNYVEKGSILIVSGSQDDLDFKDERAEVVIDDPDVGGYDPEDFTYLLVFDNHIIGGFQTTHCGPYIGGQLPVGKKCKCQDGTTDTGNCWWVSLGDMDKLLIFLPGSEASKSKEITESESDEFEWAEDFGGNDKSLELYNEIESLLEGTPYNITVETEIYSGNLERVYKIYHDPLMMDAWSEKYFTPKNIQEDLMGQLEWVLADSKTHERLSNLYNILKPFFEKHGLDTSYLNESDDFEWAEGIQPGDPSELLYLELKKFLDGKLANNGQRYMIGLDKRSGYNDYYITDGEGRYFTVDSGAFTLDNILKNLKEVYEEHSEASSNFDKKLYIEYKHLYDTLIPFSEQTFLKESEEDDFGWVSEIENLLSIEDLQKGDIVIPTCLKQEEFIVIHTGTVASSIFNEKPFFDVLMKRNADRTTGGVYLTTQHQIGKDCRFKLIHREDDLIEESEENDEFKWADDIIKNYSNSLDITWPSGSDMLKNLKKGSILRIEGVEDGLEFIDIECMILYQNPNNSLQYLVKFNDFIQTRDDEDGEIIDSTHCGGTHHGINFSKTCECSEEEGTVGKCWWISMGGMDRVIFYPEKLYLSENLNEKPLLKEGRYDSITRKAVKDIMMVVTKTKHKPDFQHESNLPEDITGEMEYTQEGMAFSVEVLVSRDVLEIEKGYYVNAYIPEDDGEGNIIVIEIAIDPTKEPQVYEELFYTLQEYVRHEIEHFTQSGEYRIEDRPKTRTKTSTLKTTFGHHKNITEIPALVNGLYRRAKLQRMPLDVVMSEYLDEKVEEGEITKNQREKLFSIWMTYAKKHLPRALYSEI